MRFSIQPRRLLRSKEARKNKICPTFKFDTTFTKKIIHLIHKNVFEMFVRCTVYDLWFDSMYRFCVDRIFCYVVWVSNQKMDEQSVCSQLACLYSLSDYKWEILVCLVWTELSPLIKTGTFTYFVAFCRFFLGCLTVFHRSRSRAEQKNTFFIFWSCFNVCPT